MPAQKHLVIIGAGVFGLFCARAATDAGWRVTILDPRAAAPEHGGRCASASAAGMLGPLSETLLEPDFAPSRLALGVTALRLWLAIGPRLLGGAFLQTGALNVGGLNEADALVALAERARDCGLRAAIMRGGAVRAAWPGLGFRASLAVRLDDEALVRPGEALLQLQKHASATCRFGVTAHGLARASEGWRVETSDNDKLSADEVLLSPGFAPAVLAWAPSLSVLQPAAGVMTALRSPVSPRGVVRGPGFYLAPRDGADIVLGSSMQFGVTETRPDVKALRALAGRLYAFAPSMKAAREVARWAGVRAMSPDWAPLIGRDAATRLLVAAGAGRNGWLYGPLAGEVIAARLRDRPDADDWRPIDPNRFSPATPPSRA